MATVPVAPKVYISQIQQDLEAAWGRGRSQLSEYMLRLEKTHSPAVHNSRILHDATYRRASVLLLSQVSNDMMVRIIRNKLMEDLKNRTYQLERWSKLQVLREPDPQNRSPKKAGIYILYLTTRTGGGLSVADYERFVAAMVAAIDGSPMPPTSTSPGRDIVSECNRFIRQYTNNRIADIADIRKACSKYRNDFVTNQRNLVTDARSDNATEIRLQGEVGWSADMDVRFGQHMDFDGSAAFFRLARCVLECLFPQTFELNGICLFRALQQKDSDHGEAMGSHIATSYAKYGGWNYTQAGMHTQSGHQLSLDRHIACANQYPALMAFIKASWDQELDLWRRRCQKQQVRFLFLFPAYLPTPCSHSYSTGDARWS